MTPRHGNQLRSVTGMVIPPAPQRETPAPKMTFAEMAEIENERAGLGQKRRAEQKRPRSENSLAARTYRAIRDKGPISAHGLGKILSKPYKLVYCYIGRAREEAEMDGHVIRTGKVKENGTAVRTYWAEEAE